MLRVRWLLAAWVLWCVACGKDGRKPIPQQVAKSFGGFVDAPRNQLAILKSPKQVAIMHGEASLIATLAVSTEDVIVIGNGDIIVVNDGTSFRGVDTTGRQLWSRTLSAEEARMGTRTFALAGSTAHLVIDISTGKTLYEDARPAERLMFQATHGYVFADRNDLWLVDESGTPKWRRRVDRLADSALSALRGSLFVLRPDRTFEEFDYTDGKVISKGTCEGHPPKTGKARDCAGHPKVDLSKIALTPLEYRDGAGVYDYYIGGRYGESDVLVARDGVGRERWRVEWPISETDLERRRVHRGQAANTVAFVSSASSRSGRVLLVFDDTTGRLVVKRSLAARERLIGLAESCWIVITSSAVVCLDASSGAETWAVPTSGSTVEAWPRTGGEALVLDGNPLALSRIGKDGRRVWHADLGDINVELLVDGTAILNRGDQHWSFSDVMAVVGAPPDLAVLDLASGKLTQVK